MLSFASQVDSGAVVRYEHLRDAFTLKQRGGSRTYVFGRKDIPGSEGRFYTCDWREPSMKSAMVATVKENLEAFTTREST